MIVEPSREEADVDAFLKEAVCPWCVTPGRLRLTGNVRYSNPLQYACRCALCGRESYCGPNTMIDDTIVWKA